MRLPASSRHRLRWPISKASSLNSSNSRTHRALLANSSTQWRSTMSNRLGLFTPPKHPVLSLSVQAQSVTPKREQRQFEVLVRHILSRFFNNELLASDDEAKRVMQIASAIALPTLIVSLFLYPGYHAFPPAPAH